MSVTLTGLLLSLVNAQSLPVALVTKAVYVEDVEISIYLVPSQITEMLSIVAG